jgi:hypothetical protein
MEGKLAKVNISPVGELFSPVESNILPVGVVFLTVGVIISPVGQNRPQSNMVHHVLEAHTENHPHHIPKQNKFQIKNPRYQVRGFQDIQQLFTY